LKNYEALFLFDTGAARDWAGMEQEVRRLCERIGANLHVCVKFDERKLAFEIKRRKRGTYVLAYFDAPPDRLHDMERDAQLSELILRAMVVRIEPLPAERLAALQAHPADTSLVPHASESRRHEDEGERSRERWSRGGERRDRGDRGERSEFGERAERREAGAERFAGDEAAVDATAGAE
jgi:small subunit ribosomal protein S6